VSDTYIWRKVQPVVRHENKLFYSHEAVDAFAQEFHAQAAAKAAAREAGETFTVEKEREAKQPTCGCGIVLDSPLIPAGTATHCGWCVAEERQSGQR
jgi:hypothetical protein